MKAEESGIGGPKPAQPADAATKSSDPAEIADGSSLAAILGRDIQDRSLELGYSLLAYEKCPLEVPELVPRELTFLAWRMLHALQDGDDAWFARLLSARRGNAFSILAADGRFSPADPLGTILSFLAALQMPLQGPALDIDEVRAFAEARDHDAANVDDKTIRSKARAAGVILKFRRRGPKLGSKREK